MRRAPRSEIEKFADDTFSVALVRILAQYNEKLQHVLGQVKLTGNSGGYVPALTQWATERNRETILALADAYVEAFRFYGAPSDTAAEGKLNLSAQQIAAGSIVSIRGQLDLMEKRTTTPVNDHTGYFNREIEASIQTAVKEGLLRLRRARWQETQEGPAESGSSGSGRASSQKPELASRQTSQQGATTSTQTETAAERADRNQPARKPVRRNPKYEKIDEALRDIAKSRPGSHEEVFRALDGRSKCPNAEPFKSARGWLAGFQRDQTRARCWLSKAWARLHLPSFSRGPK